MPANVSFKAINTGNDVSCALTGAGAGTGYCWGDNSVGQIGNGIIDYTNHTTPVAISMPSGVSFSAITIGVHHSCALTMTGADYCWKKTPTGDLGHVTL